MANCSYCGKKILWGVTVEGKRIPLDPTAPVYHYDPAAKTAVIIPQVDYYRPVMVNHFSTCAKITRRGQGPVQHVNVPPKAWFDQLEVPEGQLAVLIRAFIDFDGPSGLDPEEPLECVVDYRPTTVPATRVGGVLSEALQQMDEEADAEQPETLAESWEEVAPKPVK